MKKKITIFNYDAGNNLSVYRAFKACGADVEITDNLKKIKDSSYLVLPGDGAFGYAASQFKKLEVIPSIQNHIKKGKPLLGICLGMQILCSKSEEFGSHQGLSIIKGKTVKIKSNIKKFLKVPVIGWHQIHINENNLFKKLRGHNKKKFYFLHSFMVKPVKKNELLGYYNFGKKKIAAIIGKDNVLGFQFHPEKSGLEGIKLLKNFLKF